MTLAAAMRRRRGAVLDSADVRRVRALPRRPGGPALPPEEWTAALSDGLRGMTLRPIQAAALEALHDSGGCLAAVAVGGGKTLVSFLAPTVAEAERAVLLVPAALREKTLRDFRALEAHWVRPVGLRVMSYERLAQVNQARWLDAVRPDLLILDECHRVKDRRTAACRRIERYLREHRGTKVLAMSGTITSKSVRDFAHVAQWALGEGSPAPLHPGTVEEWALALDSRSGHNRIGPGALLSLDAGRLGDLPGDSGGEASEARRVYAARVRETPGVVVSSGRDVASSLTLERLLVDEVPHAVDSAFLRLRSDWVMPDGREVMDAMDLARSARELALGFCYAWTPLPPKWWLEPRAKWAKFVRGVVTRGVGDLDTELQVRNAVDAGDLDGEALAEWREAEGRYVPNVVERWLTPGREVVAAVATLAEKRKAELVWVRHRAVGRALADLTGWPLYAEDGLRADGLRAEDHEGPEPAILTIDSNSTGRNLQRWSRSLVAEPPANGQAWEQLIGRTHRVGQEADEVWVGWVAACAEHLSAVAQATEDARYVSEVTGHDQRLCYADRVEDGPAPGSGPRWRRG